MESWMEFNIVEKLLGFSLLGAEWILWLLLILSILSIAIMFERFFYYRAIRVDFPKFARKVTQHIENKEYDKAISLCKEGSSLEELVALNGLKQINKSTKSIEGTMESFIITQKHILERGLVVLGTLGNNAPFIGLFGTVIGIIKAFNDLSINPEGGPSVVMGSISEALVATAVGLLVAIPAVIAFNAFGRIVKKHIANSQALVRLISSANDKS